MAAPPELTIRCPVCRMFLGPATSCPRCHPAHPVLTPEHLAKPKKRSRRRPIAPAKESQP